jgi:hypothetical protein
MSTNHPRRPLPDELAWQADRFLLEELSATERAEFAQLLGSDQAAREVLAEEILLLESLTQLSAADFAPRHGVTPASVTARRGHAPAAAHSWTWIASGLLAASLLLAATIFGQWNTRKPSSPPGDLAHPRQQYEQVEQLVLLWSQGDSPDDSLAWEGGLDMREEIAAADEMAPDWMVAAVAAEAGQTGTATEQEDMQWQ